MNLKDHAFKLTYFYNLPFLQKTFSVSFTLTAKKINISDPLLACGLKIFSMIFDTDYAF